MAGLALRMCCVIGVALFFHPNDLAAVTIDLTQLAPDEDGNQAVAIDDVIVIAPLDPSRSREHGGFTLTLPPEILPGEDDGLVLTIRPDVGTLNTLAPPGDLIPGFGSRDGDVYARRLSISSNGLGLLTFGISQDFVNSGLVAYPITLFVREHESLFLQFDRPVRLTGLELWQTSPDSQEFQIWGLDADGEKEVTVALETGPGVHGPRVSVFDISDGVNIWTDRFQIVGYNIQEQFSIGQGIRLRTLTFSLEIPLPGALPLFLTGLAGLGLAGRMRLRAA